MSNTPLSGPDIVNTKALEGFMRAFDQAMTGRYHLGSVESDPAAVSKLREFEQDVLKAVMGHARAVEKQEQVHRLSFWHTFPLLRAIRRFRDNVRLRKYNREWIRSSIH